MWSRLSPLVLLTLFWSSQAFFSPIPSASRGETRCQSLRGRQEQLSGNSRRTVAASSAAIAATDSPWRRAGPAAAAALGMSVSDGGGGSISGSCDREAFLSGIARTAATAVGASVVAAAALCPTMAEAKQPEDAPVDWKAEFGSVKEATDLVLSDLRNLANNGKWDELMEQAKGYDQSIRKGLMGDVRKKMPKELKGDALTYRNNITFDLIAVNKAARTEDKPRALEVLDILESDIKDFLSLERRI